MKITLIDSRSAQPLSHRSIKDKWPSKANAAFHIDREWAVLFVQYLPSIKDGWRTNDPYGKYRKGWYFREALVDKPHEQISYQHLLKADERKVFFFHIEDCDAKRMYEIARVVRDHLEMVL